VSHCFRAGEIISEASTEYSDSGEVGDLFAGFCVKFRLQLVSRRVAMLREIICFIERGKMIYVFAIRDKFSIMKLGLVY
jgi:hypothetical protein